MKIVFAIFVVFGIVACNKLPVKEEIIIKDTVVDTTKAVTDSVIIRQAHQLRLYQNELSVVYDSLNAVRDTLDSVRAIFNVEHSELFVAKYKLQRIQKYCDIAKKSNNSKYLRGWILRTLKD